jgi:hypothetical protein
LKVLKNNEITKTSFGSGIGELSISGIRPLRKVRRLSSKFKSANFGMLMIKEGRKHPIRENRTTKTVVTRKALMEKISGLLKDLKGVGYSPSRVVLFGSYAKGNPHAYSDIDLAIWDKHFIGCGTVDIVPIVSIVSRYPGLENHTFAEDETKESNPFIEEILKHGIEIPFQGDNASVPHLIP